MRLVGEYVQYKYTLRYSQVEYIQYNVYTVWADEKVVWTNIPVSFNVGKKLIQIRSWMSSVDLLRV